MSEIVQSERHGAVVLLRLNRPEALNALSDAVLEALCACARRRRGAGGARCVVLCGAGRAFAAGADVAGLRALAADDVLGGERGAALAAVRRCAAAGDRGRARLVPRRRLRAGADLRHRDRGRGRALRPARDGPRADPGRGRDAAAAARRRKSLALEMILAGRMLSAREALRAGICSRVVAPEALSARRSRSPRASRRGPPLAVRLAREAVRIAFETPLEAGLARGAAAVRGGLRERRRARGHGRVRRARGSAVWSHDG